MNFQKIMQDDYKMNVNEFYIYIYISTKRESKRKGCIYHLKKGWYKKFAFMW